MQLGHCQIVDSLGCSVFRVSLSMMGLVVLCITMPLTCYADPVSAHRRDNNHMIIHSGTSNDEINSFARGNEQDSLRPADSPDASTDILIAFDIAPQNMGTALIQFGHQANVSVLIQHQLHDVKTAGVKGNYSYLDGLDALLVGTQLDYKNTDAGIVVYREVAIIGARSETSSEQSSQSKSWFGRILATLAGTAVLASGSAVAQETRDRQMANERGIEEVVVTAQRRTESVQDVPLAISAINADGLLSRGIESPQDLQFSVPGLTITGTELGQAKVTIRGVGFASEVAIGSDPGVPLHIDGHYTQASSFVTRDMFDVERVEVLRGPQGTLYGRNALGGTINIITKRPSEEFEAEVAADAGNFNKLLLQGVMSGPFSDSLRGRVAFSTENRDGYITNISNGDDLNDSDYAMIRGALEWDISDKGTALLSGFSYRDDSNAPGAQVSGEYPQEPLLLGFVPNPWLAPGVGSNLPEDARRVRSELTPDNTNDADGMFLSIDWNLYGADFRSLTGYNDTSANLSHIDIDGSDLVFTEANSIVGWETFTQEFQLLSNNNSNVKWVVGAFYYDEKSNFKYELEFFSLAGPGNANTLFVGGPQKVNSTSKALFGQLDWSIMDDLVLVAGLRHTKDEKDVDERVFFGAVGDPIVPFSATDEESWNKTTGKLGLNYSLNEDVMVYGEISNGYKAGGFNAGSLQGSPYDPETITAYQAGVKSQLFSWMRLNVAAYYYDYKDKQESKIDDLLVVFENAGAATATGIEMELHMRPTEALTIDSSLTYQNAEYDEFLTEDPLNPELGLQDMNGNSLPYSPELKFYLGAQYDWQIKMGSVSARVDYSWTDSYFFRAYNLDSDTTDSFHRTNARLAWTSNDTRWYVSLYGKNLENEDVRSYQTAAASILGNVTNARYFAPRTYGVQARYSF